MNIEKLANELKELEYLNLLDAKSLKGLIDEKRPTNDPLFMTANRTFNESTNAIKVFRIKHKRKITLINMFRSEQWNNPLL